MTNLSLLNLPHTFTPVRTFQGIEEFVLSNGLKVLLFQDVSQANLTVNITYLVGSRHEGRGEAGMAHLLEHMLFRGTHQIRDVKAALQDRGAQFNATTWYDRTNYYETLTPSEENLAFALKLEADRMVNSLILAEDLASEMTVVRNEFEMGENNPIHVLHDQVMSAAYRWHNYGKSTIGNRSDIERVPASTLKKFYEYYYQPDNAVLVVSGQFDRQKAIDLINQYFAVLKKPERVLEQTYTEEPPQDGPREVILERVGDMASVGVAYHIPAASHRDHAAIRILIDVLTDEPGGIIYKELVATGRCSELFGMTYALCEPGMALCFLRPVSDDTALVIRDELQELIESRAFKSLDEEQINRIKARQLKRFKLALSNSKDVALKLSEAIACGDWRLFFWNKEQIKKVNLEDVIRVAHTYLVGSNRTSGIFVPQKEAARVVVERVESVADVLKDLAEDRSLKAGEAFVASAQNIENLVLRKNKSALLSKKTRGELVNAYMIMRYGHESVLNNYKEELTLLPALLWRGSDKYDYQQIRDKLDALMSTMDLGGHAGLITSSIKSEKENIKGACELLAHILKSPAFKPEEFRIVKQREIDDCEEVKSDPQRLCLQELERLKNPWPRDSIHYVQSYEEKIADLKALSLPRIKEAFENLVGCQNLCVALVGDTDEQALDYFSHVFGDSPNKPAYERIKRPFINNLVQEQSFNTPDKEMAVVAMAANFAMRDDHPDYAALKLANYMFGENMNSRLMNRIREKEGISYGAGSWLEISRHEATASFSMYALAAPASVGRACKAMREEWERFVSAGVEEKELKSAQESIWLSFENLLASDGYLVSTLARDLEIGRNFSWRENLFLTMKKLGPADIKRAVQKWWQEARFSQVIAGDQAKIQM
jgi:zinc protease